MAQSVWISTQRPCLLPWSWPRISALSDAPGFPQPFCWQPVLAMLRQEALRGDSVQPLHVTFERLRRKHFKDSGRKKRYMLVQALTKGPASSCNPGGGEVMSGKSRKSDPERDLCYPGHGEEQATVGGFANSHTRHTEPAKCHALALGRDSSRTPPPPPCRPMSGGHLRGDISA